MKLAYLIIPFSVHRPLLAAELTLWNSQQKLLPVAVIDCSPVQLRREKNGSYSENAYHTAAAHRGISSRDAFIRLKTD